MFFPLGAILGLYAAVLWIFRGFGIIYAYPANPHAQLMVGGFILSFVIGFSTTAIPRFTQTQPAQHWEMAIMMLALLASSSLALIGSSALSFLFSSIALTHLGIFALRRYRHRASEPPHSFVFIPIGILFGLLGSGMLALIQFTLIPVTYYSVGTLFFYRAMIFSFVVGVGSFLIPSILGFSPHPLHTLSNTKSNRRFVASPELNLFSAALFITGIIIETAGSPQTGRLISSSIITILVFIQWKIYRLPTRQNKLHWGIWISAYMLLIGLWLSTLYTALEIHAFHIIFIGGFTLLTLMIASRVILSHGGHGLDFESKSASYIWITLLLIIAAFGRFLASLFPESYFRHLGYAALLWVVAVGAWGAIFIPQIARRSLDHGDFGGS